MTAPTLKEAIRLVETLGLAPLARAANTKPKTYLGDGYRRWMARRHELAAIAAEKLREHGASVTLDRDPVRVRFAGITASSTQGLQQALKNWKAAAEKRLKGVRR